MFVILMFYFLIIASFVVCNKKIDFTDRSLGDGDTQVEICPEIN